MKVSRASIMASCLIAFSLMSCGQNAQQIPGGNASGASSTNISESELAYSANKNDVINSEDTRGPCQARMEGSHAIALCNVKDNKKQYRVRADCKYAPDRYSNWMGKGKYTLRTGDCLLGIQGAVMEER